MSAVVPVPVGIVAVDTPDSTFTMVEPEVTAVTILALVADTVTLLPAVTPDSAMRSASAELTSLSEGTGSAIALAEVVPAEAGDAPATVSVADDALAGPATSMVAARATAEAIAISGFFNEVIYFFLLIYLINNLQ
jgi:hypothetical protein